MYEKTPKRKSVWSRGSTNDTSAGRRSSDSLRRKVTVRASVAWSLLISILLACGESARTAFPGPFRARESEASIATRLADRGATWIEIDEGGVDANDPRPPFSVKRWGVDAQGVWGRSGEIELTFANGQLAAVWWYPSASDEPGSPICEECGEPRSGTDFRGKQYWAWEDAELVEMMNAWLADHS